MKYPRSPRLVALVLALGVVSINCAVAQEPDQEHGKMRAPLPSAEEIAKLPRDGGDEFNRLVFEQSPYLLQHARNPVNWYPWGGEAFHQAALLGKPVFLSVGYSTCHWCHVMEHESFEDEEVAALLNEHFVCVKVDREERPDIDQVYMRVTQAMSGGAGGWPNTVIMTSEKKPFFAGTYFPKTGRFGRVGMMDLIPQIATAWKDQREELLAQADRVTEFVADRSGGSPGGVLGVSALEIADAQLQGRFDSKRGGFGSAPRFAPKFPVPHNLRYLLRSHARTGNPRLLQMVEETLRAWRLGGMWDHVGFGVHRYSTDRDWLLPHFEKMLYDQALCAMAYVEAWQVTGNDEYRAVANEIFAYVLRDMTAPEGGFYSAEDADSEGEEGLFYLWRPEELIEVLGEEDGQLAIEVWNVVEGGNFTDQAAGQKTGESILHLKAPLGQIANERGVDPVEFAVRIESMRERLFTAREPRVHPQKDDKVLTDWNGLMIASLAKAARAFDDERYLVAARRSADFMLAELRTDEGRLLKRWRRGSAGLGGMLEDYAFATWGLLELYEADFDERYLVAAIELTDVMVAHFRDEEGGGFFLSPDDGEKLIVRSKEIYDGAIPSGNSVAFENLLRLSRITANVRYEELAEETLQAFSGAVAGTPNDHTELMCGVAFSVGPSYEIVIAGERDAEDTRAMLRALHREFLPNKVVVLRPDGAEEPPIVKLAPYVALQTAVDGKATAYVCQDFTCRAPVTDVDALLASLRATDEDESDGGD